MVFVVVDLAETSAVTQRRQHFYTKRVSIATRIYDDDDACNLAAEVAASTAHECCFYCVKLVTP